jgi:phosphate transport system substrate-binding protein
MNLVQRVWLVAGLCVAFGCEARTSSHKAAAKAPTTQSLVLTGSSTVAPLATEIAERFEGSHPGIKIDVQTGGSSRGIADARSGLADLGMVSRALKSTEHDLQAFTIARDGIAIIVHRSNPVAALSSAQVRSIFRGEHSSWDALGELPRTAIIVVHKAEGRSTGELFLEHFELKPSEVKPAVIIGDNEQGLKTVANNPAAIGYVSIGSAEYAIANGVPIKFVPVDGAVPSREAVRSGTFPVARPLQLVSRGAPNSLAQDFVAFARSPAVNDLIDKHVFVAASN